MKRYKAIIFDLDGTLLNTLDDLAEAGNRALEAAGLQAHPISAYRGMVGNGIPVLVRRMLPDGGADEGRFNKVYYDFITRYNAHMSDKTAPYFGAEALLRRLKADGYILGVLSNKDDALAGPIVEGYFTDVFHMVRGLKEGFPPKPDPASLIDMLDTLGLQKHEVLFCGDSGVDVRTGKAAGLCVCGVLWGFRDREELLEEGADYLAADFDELAALIGM